MIGSYKNTRGEIYFLKSKLTKKGNTTYYRTMKKDNECEKETPQGYEVFERYDTGMMFVRKIKKKVFKEEEIQLIQQELKNNKTIEDFKLDINGNLIKIYAFEKPGFGEEKRNTSVHGEKHFGVVLIPHGVQPHNSPIILELHGVDSRYSPFKVSKAKMPKILGNNPSKAIIVIPSFRGNTLLIEDQVYTSEGSPKNAWDGVADDAIAFLNIVLHKIPEADPARISAFGKSRGGTVAMLVGIRDDRIGSIVNWAGPSGWFFNMGTFGWSLQEQVQWALWERWPPGRGWGSASQFIDWFLAESINSKKSNLHAVRHNILASSPLYFLESLPVAQMHYGVEDGSVPIINAEAIQSFSASLDSSIHNFEIYKHENIGHDQPYPRAYQLTNEFLTNNFSKN